MLQRLHSRTGDAQVSVAPHAACAPAAAVDVAVGNVHAADVAAFAVNHHYFAVVAPIDALGKLREVDSHKRICFDAGVEHGFEEPFVDVERANTIVDYSHFYALTSFFDENVAYFVADAVVLENVVLHVDVLRGSTQVGTQGVEFVGTVGVDVHLVVREIVGAAHGVGKPDGLLCVLRESQALNVHLIGFKLLLAHAPKPLAHEQSAAQRTPEEHI